MIWAPGQHLMTAAVIRAYLVSTQASDMARAPSLGRFYASSSRQASWPRPQIFSSQRESLTLDFYKEVSVLLSISNTFKTMKTRWLRACQAWSYYLFLSRTSMPRTHACAEQELWRGTHISYQMPLCMCNLHLVLDVYRKSDCRPFRRQTLCRQILFVFLSGVSRT